MPKVGLSNAKNNIPFGPKGMLFFSFQSSFNPFKPIDQCLAWAAEIQPNETYTAGAKSRALVEGDMPFSMKKSCKGSVTLPSATNSLKSSQAR